MEPPVAETLPSLQQMNGKNKASNQNSRENKEIDMYTVLQITYYITYNFRKAGFAKCNNALMPVLFLGTNEWMIRLRQYLRQGSPMVHLVAFFGQAEEKKSLVW